LSYIATVPYAVLTLLGDRVVNSRQAGGISQATRSRQDLFKQEILVECQARKEIVDYVESLNDVGQYEEAFECIWPLEEHRRRGWAGELLTAFPGECKRFVEKVSALGETANVGPNKGEGQKC
jgi:hypothetical protein